MTPPDLRSGDCYDTVIIRQNVPHDKAAEYLRWLTILHGQLRQRAGFVSIETIRQDIKGAQEFMIVATLASHADLASWLASDELQIMRKKLDAIAATDRIVAPVLGHEIWFGDVDRRSPEAPYWKRVVLSIVCVYSVLIATKSLIHMIIGPLNFYLDAFLQVVILSAILTYPIMPFAVRVMNFWLFPGQKPAASNNGASVT